MGSGQRAALRGLLTPVHSARADCAQGPRGEGAVRAGSPWVRAQRWRRARRVPRGEGAVRAGTPWGGRSARRDQAPPALRPSHNVGPRGESRLQEGAAALSPGVPSGTPPVTLGTGHGLSLSPGGGAAGGRPTLSSTRTRGGCRRSEVHTSGSAPRGPQGPGSAFAVPLSGGTRACPFPVPVTVTKNHRKPTEKTRNSTFWLLVTCGDHRVCGQAGHHGRRTWWTTAALL